MWRGGGLEGGYCYNWNGGCVEGRGYLKNGKNGYFLAFCPIGIKYKKCLRSKDEQVWTFYHR